MSSHPPIVAWHRAFVSNGPTEAVNNLIRRIKRFGFGYRKFSHYRIRVLLYAGKPNGDLLRTITPRSDPKSPPHVEIRPVRIETTSRGDTAALA